jgi:hypothetical protein
VSGTFPPVVNATVQDSESTKVSDEGSNTTRGHKRKGDEATANNASSAKKHVLRVWRTKILWVSWSPARVSPAVMEQ